MLKKCKSRFYFSSHYVVVEACLVGSISQNQHAGEGAEAGKALTDRSRSRTVSMEKTVLSVTCVPCFPKHWSARKWTTYLHFGVCTRDSENSYQVTIYSFRTHSKIRTDADSVCQALFWV